MGWVLSGPLKGFCDDSQVNVHLVGHNLSRNTNYQELEDSMQKLWDYETLGIREDDEVHEALKDAIFFNGKRYEVSLPWKEGHGPLPSNYQNGVKRLEGQLKRLIDKPPILNMYDAIIKGQEECGKIEKVSGLETHEKIHYLPHHAVIRKDSKTTKVRIV